jgi:hypothetical protein
MAQTIPLSVPDELLKEVRETAKATNLSVQDVFRQSTKLGMAVLRQSVGRVPRPRRLSMWDALPSLRRLPRNAVFPEIKDKVHKISL